MIGMTLLSSSDWLYCSDITRIANRWSFQVKVVFNCVPYEIRFFPMAVEGQTVLLIASGRQKSYLLCYEISQSSDSITGQRTLMLKKAVLSCWSSSFLILFTIWNCGCQRPGKSQGTTRAWAMYWTLNIIVPRTFNGETLRLSKGKIVTKFKVQRLFYKNCRISQEVASDFTTMNIWRGKSYKGLKADENIVDVKYVRNLSTRVQHKKSVLWTWTCMISLLDYEKVFCKHPA